MPKAAHGHGETPHTESLSESSEVCIVCGSCGEIANDKSLPKTFDVNSDEEEVTSNEVLENQKAVIWTEIAVNFED